MRAISPIIGTVLVILIAIAMAVVLYLGVSTFIEGSTRNAQGIKTIRVDAYVEGGKVYVYSTESTFFLVVKEPKTWVDAMEYCKSRGYILATPISKRFNDFLVYVMGKEGLSSIWIGVYQKPYSEEPAGGWGFITGEEFTFSNWAAGEPDNLEGGSVATMDSTGLWRDSNSEVLRPFICERQRVSFVIHNLSNDPIPLGDVTVQGLVINPETKWTVVVFSHKLNETYTFDINRNGTPQSIAFQRILCDKASIAPNDSIKCKLVHSNGMIEGSMGVLDLCVDVGTARSCDKVST